MNDSNNTSYAVSAPTRHDVKRASPIGHDVVERPLKRPKTAKACVTCRQQKTRCEYKISNGGQPVRCTRCTRFNAECSFERDPPPPPTYPLASSTSTSSTNLRTSQSHANPAREGPIGAVAAMAVGESILAREPSRTTSPIRHAESPEREDFGSISSYPVAPMSPPRSVDHSNPTRYSMDLVQNDLIAMNWRGATVNVVEQWASPLLFAWDLMEASVPRKLVKSKSTDNLVALGIVSAKDAEILSEIWAYRYAPWLPTESSSRRTMPAQSSAEVPSADSHQPATSGFLQATQWILAARHLSDAPLPPSSEQPRTSPYAELRARLCATFQRRLTRAVMGLDNSILTLRALIILVAWPSIFAAQLHRNEALSDSTSPDVHHDPLTFDPELLVSAAARMASQMHLEQDVEKALGFARDRDELMPYTTQELEILDRARTAFKITVANTMLHLSKGRVCSTLVPLEWAEKIFGSPGLLVTLPDRGSDARLVFECDLLTIALRTADITTVDEIPRPLGVEAWGLKVKEEFKNLDHLQQSFTSAAALVDPSETLSMAIVIFHSHFLRLNMWFRVFRALYRMFPDQGHMQPASEPEDQENAAGSTRHGTQVWGSPLHLSNQPEAHPIVHDLGGKARDTCEAFITSVLALSRRQEDSSVPGDPVLSPIACAPDCISYAMLMGPAFASKLHLVAMSFFKEIWPGHEMVRSLLQRVLSAFRDGAGVPRSPSDVARDSKTASIYQGPLNPLAGRCADVLHVVLRLWDTKTREFLAQNHAGLDSRCHPKHKGRKSDGQPTSTPPSMTLAEAIPWARPTTSAPSTHPLSASPTASHPSSSYSDLPPQASGSGSGPSSAHYEPSPQEASGTLGTMSVAAPTPPIDFGDLSQLFGVPLDFNAGPFFDPSMASFLFHSVDNPDPPSPPSWSYS